MPASTKQQSKFLTIFKFKIMPDQNKLNTSNRSDIYAKAAEAAQSAYYDPNRPQCAYVPPPEYYESPPAYTKKYQ